MSGRLPDPVKTGYAEREVAKTQAQADIATTTIHETSALLRSLIEASASHPVLGCVFAFILADVLAKGRVISPGTASAIMHIAGVAFGATVTLEVVEGVASITHVFGGPQAPNPADLIRPSATTIVSNPPTPPMPSRGSVDIGALSAALKKGVPPGALL